MPNIITEKSSNSQLVYELIEILKEEASLFETFLDLLEKQQRALVKNDLEEINRITGLQREKAVMSRRLIKRREDVIGKLTLDGASNDDLTISRLIDSVASGQAIVMGQLRNSILDLNDKITKVRNQNAMLINRSRENIVKTMELISRIGAPNSSYQSQGKVESMRTNIAVDRRV
ncbi:MAG TPA: flagellar protein FlgN [candidate division Zixibacteria bacterium]|nr:flagellar protein FlgN [candidate division Zixibacteria bacterium]